MALSRLADAPPSVERSSVWIDTVRHGELLRQVSGPGTLVPEEIRWVTATTAGRVEAVHVEPGTRVEVDTLLVEMSNPDLELAALEAQRQLNSAEADLANLRAMLDIERLAQKSVMASVRIQHREARRRAEAEGRLAEAEIVGALEYARTRERAEELAGRLEIEKERSRILDEAMQARMTARTAQVEQLRDLARFRLEQVESLRVRAGLDGVLQELPLEVGQRVTPGSLLAKVVEPERLKAGLRIPEAQAKEVQLGQRVEVDTHNGIVAGHVVRIDPSVQRGTVTVDVALDGELPRGARPDLSVDGRIELERLEDVLYTGRPAFGRSNSRITLFKLVDGGSTATRVVVQLGGSSVSEVQILDGLEEGDRVILSDMSEWDATDRIELD
ncbi:MAG: HlyD family efflux transporter periplasmic adaptor subunit [Myxococcota bacterium]